MYYKKKITEKIRKKLTCVRIIAVLCSFVYSYEDVLTKDELFSEKKKSPCVISRIITDAGIEKFISYS